MEPKNLLFLNEIRKSIKEKKWKKKGEKKYMCRLKKEINERLEKMKNRKEIERSL